MSSSHGYGHGHRKLHKSNRPKTVCFDKVAVRNQRNNKVVWRYYYYEKIKRLRYEDTLDNLGNEFFLAPQTIAGILMVNELTVFLMKNNPTLKEVEKNNYPLVFEVTFSEKKKYNETIMK